MTGKIIERQGFRPRSATRSLRPRDYSKRPRFTMLWARDTEPSPDPSIPVSGSRTTFFRHRWGWQQTSLILAAPIALQPTRFHMHKTLRPVSSQPTCLPSTCAGSRSERNTNFKWDSAGSSGISGIPRGERSCTLEGSCALGTSSHARRVVRAWGMFARSKGRVGGKWSRAPIPMMLPPRASRACGPLALALHDAIMAHKPRSLHRTMLRGVDGRALPFRLRSAVLRVLRARPAQRRARQSPGGQGASLSFLIGDPASHHTLHWEGRAAQRRRSQLAR